MVRPDVEHIRRIELFSGVSSAALRRLQRECRVRVHDEQEVVVRQGEPGEELFGICSGHLKVHAVGPGGHDMGFGVMVPGEAFGEVAVIDGGPRSATVTTLDPAVLLVIGKETFFDIVRSEGDVALKLLVAFSGRLRSLSARSEDIAFRTVPERVASRLLSLIERCGEPLDRGVRLPFRLSQSEIGELVGATRESVNKRLSTWRRLGIASHTDGWLVVHDPAALASVDDA